MTSNQPIPGLRQPVKIYLDANVLAAGFVRTLLLLCGPVSDHRSVWSLYAERQAANHQPPGALAISVVRKRHELTIVADASLPIPLVGTDEDDMPIWHRLRPLVLSLWSLRTSKTSASTTFRLCRCQRSTPTYSCPLASLPPNMGLCWMRLLNLVNVSRKPQQRSMPPKPQSNSRNCSSLTEKCLESTRPSCLARRHATSFGECDASYAPPH
jgi:hypothetical protein